MKRSNRPMFDAALEPETRAQLLTQAKQLARMTFVRPGRAHVQTVYERLAWNRQHGLDEAGAVTVH